MGEKRGCFLCLTHEQRVRGKWGKQGMKRRAVQPLWQLGNCILDWTWSLILPTALGPCHFKCSWTKRTIMAPLLQRAGQLLSSWTCACECLRESVPSLLRWESSSERLYKLWLQSIITRSNWLQLLIAGPMLIFMQTKERWRDCCLFSSWNSADKVILSASPACIRDQLL